MSADAEKMEIELVLLPAGERAAEAAWDTELARRADEIKSGKAKGEPAALVFAELREKYS